MLLLYIVSLPATINQIVCAKLQFQEKEKRMSAFPTLPFPPSPII